MYLPKELWQEIQDKDPEVRLYETIPGIKRSQRSVAMSMLQGKKLRGAIGRRANIMYAYSSGNVKVCIPDRIKNTTRYKMIVYVYGSYMNKMEIFKKIMRISSWTHLKLLNV
jgi:hypothetical protein